MKHLSFAFITVSKVCTVMFLGTPPAQHVVRTDRKAIHRRWWGSWPEAAVLRLLHRGVNGASSAPSDCGIAPLPVVRR